MNSQLLKADELGLRLKLVAGLPIWEASPVIRHQLAVDRIRASFKKSEAEETVCECVHIADIYVQFPRNSLNLNADVV
jgi:hypothetical protein